jgi:hypothetical protein
MKSLPLSENRTDKGSHSRIISVLIAMLIIVSPLCGWLTPLKPFIMPFVDFSKFIIEQPGRDTMNYFDYEKPESQYDSISLGITALNVATSIKSTYFHTFSIYSRTVYSMSELASDQCGCMKEIAATKSADSSRTGHIRNADTMETDLYIKNSMGVIIL